MNHATAILEQGKELRAMGRLTAAVTLLEEHLRLFASVPEIHALLGQIYEQMGNHADAICHLENAVALAPHLLDALFTLGVAHQMSGNHLCAIDLFNQVIEAAPTLPHTYRYRGLALQELGREAEAKVSFEQALALNPEYPEAMGSLAHLLMKHSHFGAAETLLLRALELKPAMNDVQNSLARLYQLEGKSEEASAMFEGVFRAEPDNRLALSNYLYSLCYLDSVPPEETAAKHISLCERYFPVVDNPKSFQKRHHFSEERRLRIGYLSNDFCLHSVSFFLEPVLINHDRSRFEIFCYSNRTAADETTLRIRSLDLKWRDISNRPAVDAVQLIQGDKIDILVDLAGHTARNRMDICALKPAPVLATWIGYPHSTGMQQFNYYISDSICDPSSMTDRFFCEKVWRLPRVFSCYLPPMEFPQVSPPPYKRNGYITFGSFNNIAKVSETTIKLWSDVMKWSPDACFFVKSASLGGNSAQKRLIERFASHGVSENRLILKAHTPTPLEHLKLYAEVDIALDTFPYHGTTTTCEALWMGVPVVTCAGKSHLSRVGASFLKNVGCEELVAETLDEFVTISSGLASDRNRIDEYRESLRAAMATSSLMDGAGVTREVEDAYRTMFAIFMNSEQAEA